VAQAQALWNEGSRGAAALLLKGALEQVDPSSGADLLDTASVATLAREYARVTLASGQAGETLAALERLEPRLAGVADIWAIRANAAQRLGRHPAAVAAYRQALALRPEEPRWALGTAVSLAAMGQAGPAAEYAEKARIAKALPLDVANYLRQLGVTVKSD
jgi:tetratricopeptide (TPR) repeat protein